MLKLMKAYHNLHVIPNSIMLPLQQLPLVSFDFRKDHKKTELTLIWKENEKHKTQVREVVTIFTEINCILEMDPDAGPLKWKVPFCIITSMWLKIICIKAVHMYQHLKYFMHSLCSHGALALLFQWGFLQCMNLSNRTLALAEICSSSTATNASANSNALCE